jgi:hypothetical protein
VKQLQALEPAVEEVEVNAFASLCKTLVHAEWRATDKGKEIAAAGPLPDDPELKAVSSDGGWVLVRRPDPESRLELSPDSLRLRATKLAEARQTLETLGFALPQQWDRLNLPSRRTPALRCGWRLRRSGAAQTRRTERRSGSRRIPSVENV